MILSKASEKELGLMNIKAKLARKTDKVIVKIPGYHRQMIV